MLPHVDKVKIPEINSSPSVSSLSCKEKEFGYKWLLKVHVRHEQREKCQNPSQGERKGRKVGNSETQNLPFAREFSSSSLSPKSKWADPGTTKPCQVKDTQSPTLSQIKCDKWQPLHSPRCRCSFLNYWTHLGPQNQKVRLGLKRPSCPGRPDGHPTVHQMSPPL